MGGNISATENIFFLFRKFHGELINFIYGMNKKNQGKEAFRRNPAKIKTNRLWH